MKDFALFNDTFSVSKTNTYHLSILLKPSGISYAIVDTVRRKCVAVKNSNFEGLSGSDDYLVHTREFIENESFLSKPYKSTDFVFSSRKATIIPAELFDKKLLKHYFTFTHQLDDFEEIHFNRLNKVDAVNVFSIPSDLTTLMVNHFPELRFYHQATAFIDNTLLKSDASGYVVGVMSYKNYFDIVVCNNGKLFLYNNFDFQNENDFVYHISNVIQQLRISDLKTNIFLSGDIDKDSPKYKLLIKYLRNVWFAKIPENASVKYMFREIPEHYLSNLINIS